MPASEPPPCGPGDVTMTVLWERREDGHGLRGQVIAENVSGRACRLPGKPTVTPLEPDGKPLDVWNVRGPVQPECVQNRSGSLSPWWFLPLPPGEAGR